MGAWRSAPPTLEASTDSSHECFLCVKSVVFRHKMVVRRFSRSGVAVFFFLSAKAHGMARVCVCRNNIYSFFRFCRVCVRVCVCSRTCTCTRPRPRPRPRRSISPAVVLLSGVHAAGLACLQAALALFGAFLMGSGWVGAPTLLCVLCGLSKGVLCVCRLRRCRSFACFFYFRPCVIVRNNWHPMHA